MFLCYFMNDFFFTINLFNHIEINIQYWHKYIRKKFKTYSLIYLNSKNYQTTFDKQAYKN